MGNTSAVAQGLFVLDDRGDLSCRSTGWTIGKRTDVVPLMQAQMETVDMVPDNPGIWMFHCHIDDHMDAGMATLYKVEP